MPSEGMNYEAMDEFSARQRARALEERALDERIVNVLESAPDRSFSIPSDFASSVAAKVPARRSVSLKPTHYGWTVMSVSLAVLFVILVVLAIRGFERSSFGLAVQWCLCAQFLALAVWMGTRRWKER